MFTREIMSWLFKNPNHVLTFKDPAVIMKEIMSWLFKDPAVIMKEIMSWLFKDSINSGLAQFDHAQSNSKIWPKR